MNIRKISLAKVVCDNSDTVDRIQRSIFDIVDPYLNPHVRCDQLTGLDFQLWQDAGICNISEVSIAVGSSARITPCMTCTCTKEGPFCQSVAVRNCRTLLNNFPISALMGDDVCKTQCSSFLKLTAKDDSRVAGKSVSDLFATFM